MTFAELLKRRKQAVTSAQCLRHVQVSGLCRSSMQAASLPVSDCKSALLTPRIPDLMPVLRPFVHAILLLLASASPHRRDGRAAMGLLWFWRDNQLRADTPSLNHGGTIRCRWASLLIFCVLQLMLWFHQAERCIIGSLARYPSAS
jgi:hypothetical protein